jgi:outer membrane lipoprotein-sorting protein
MRTSRLSRHAPWAVPTLGAAVVVAGFAMQPLLASADSAGLPQVTADELVADLLAAEPQPLSGTVVYSADLGFPDINALKEAIQGPITVADPTLLLSGTSTIRVWTDAEQRSRVTLEGTASEYSVVHDATQAWTYSSDDRSVVHYTLDAEDAAQLAQARAQAQAGTLDVPGDLPTPAAMADDILSQVEEYSTVTLDAETSVAGRSAYQLVVTPRSTTTLIGRVTIAVDSATHIPLKVAVWSRSDAQNPALEVGFTDLDLSMPSDQVLSWSTPSGATVKDVTIPVPTPGELGQADDASVGATTTGTGWDTVLTLTGAPVDALDATSLTDMAATPGVPMPQTAQEYADLNTDAGFGFDPSAVLDSLSTEVDGGRIISSSLVSILICDDGRVLVGAVAPSVLTTLAG